jgi:hypothetical protein
MRWTVCAVSPSLTKETGLPALRVHDLRHVAPDIMITDSVPVAVVSER